MRCVGKTALVLRLSCRVLAPADVAAIKHVSLEWTYLIPLGRFCQTLAGRFRSIETLIIRVRGWDDEPRWSEAADLAREYDLDRDAADFYAELVHRPPPVRVGLTHPGPRMPRGWLGKGYGSIDMGFWEETLPVCWDHPSIEANPDIYFVTPGYHGSDGTRTAPEHST